MVNPIEHLHFIAITRSCQLGHASPRPYQRGSAAVAASVTALVSERLEELNDWNTRYEISICYISYIYIYIYVWYEISICYIWYLYVILMYIYIYISSCIIYVDTIWNVKKMSVFSYLCERDRSWNMTYLSSGERRELRSVPGVPIFPTHITSLMGSQELPRVSQPFNRIPMLYVLSLIVSSKLMQCQLSIIWYEISILSCFCWGDTNEISMLYVLSILIQYEMSISPYLR